MYIRSYLQDKRLTIAMTGEIDHHEAKYAIKTVQEKIEANLPKVCVLDFRDVSFMDSSGIAVVICAVRRMRQVEGDVILENVPPQPGKVLRAAGIEQIAEFSSKGADQ